MKPTGFGPCVENPHTLRVGYVVFRYLLINLFYWTTKEVQEKSNALSATRACFAKATCETL